MTLTNCLSADLFQSSSVLDYSCNPQCLPIQHPQSLPILTHLEASEHPSIPECRNPLFDHLKGVTACCNPGPQGISRRQTLSPQPSPWALKLMLPRAKEFQIAHWSTLSNPVDPTCHPVIQMRPRAPKWSSKHPILSDSSLRGRRQRR